MWTEIDFRRWPSALSFWKALADTVGEFFGGFHWSCCSKEEGRIIIKYINMLTLKLIDHRVTMMEVYHG